MRLFQKLRRKLDYLNADEITLVKEAYSCAQKAHIDQKRSCGLPYITHPVAVAMILADIHMDCQTVIAALLHDVVEDTSVSKFDIEKQFGKDIADLVDGVTKLTQIKFKSKAEAQAESFRKMVLAMAEDIRVIIVKLADRLHNMRTLGGLPYEKQRRIALQTIEIFAPIANRLGMRLFSDELEDLGFAAMYPRRYQVLKQQLKRTSGGHHQLVNAIENTIRLGLEKSTLKNFELSGREKKVYSLYKKMRKKEVGFSEVMDVYGYRVLVDSVDDCYRCLGIIHGIYKPIQEHFKDYIAMPKANGYQSLHTTLFGPNGVPVEIQIRSRKMDELAKSGISAHWLYKSGDQHIDYAHIKTQEWLNKLLEIQSRTGNSMEFIENVKIDLFPHEVYVFSPQGEIKALPAGATALDFAYSIHTNIGHGALTVKIDRKMAALSTRLRNSQTVEVVTSERVRPNAGWLNFVVTGRARSAIRHYLKNQKQSESVSLGQSMLEAALVQIELKLGDVSQAEIKQVLKESGYDDLVSLLAAIGLGHQSASLIAHRFQLMHATKNKPAVTGQPEKKSSPLLISGSEGVVVTFATCCHPIPDDAIVGLLSPGHGIMVHQVNCEMVSKNIKNQVIVEWSKKIKAIFSVSIEVLVHNGKGVLAAIAMAISNLDASIENFQILNSDSQARTIIITLAVTNRLQLASLMRHIKKLPSVIRIKRYRTD